MKKLRLSLLGILTFIVLFQEGQAQGMSATWQVLFNGKDFTGWRELNGKHKWEVKDGVIVGTDVHGQPNGFLCTEKEYEDFILELEVSIDTLMNNSGVQFRTISTPEYLNGRVRGYQMEVDPKPQKWSGSIYEEGGTRHWLYTTELNKPGKKAFKNNQWNKYRIECFGNTIRTWVNGIPVSHLVDNKFPRGFIGLQLHANNPNDPPGGNQVRYRNIRIKTTGINPSPLDDVFVVNLLPNHLSAQEKKEGYTLLWDGKTTTGWKNASSGKTDNGGWKIEDNTLALGSNGDSNVAGQDLITTEQFSSFILKFDFKISAGSNGGIRYLIPSGVNSTLEGLEYQIVDDSIPGLATNQKLGALTGILAPSEPVNRFFFQKRKRGEWNQGMIKVLPDNHVEYWLNGFKVLDYTLNSKEFQELRSQSKYSDQKSFGTNRKGSILLEGGDGTIAYRSLKIKKLSK